MCFLGAPRLVIKEGSIVAKTTRTGGLTALANAFARTPVAVAA